MKHQRFSFIEVLVTIAIIGILASMVLGQFWKAREHAYQTACASGLKEIGSSFYVHMKENKNYLPTYNWMISANIQNNYICPKDSIRHEMDFFMSSDFDRIKNDPSIKLAGLINSFGFNLSASSQKGTEIDNPHDFVAMFDSNDLSGIEEGSSAGGGDPDESSKSGKGNNGHGNNADGVDSSNPGQSKKGEDSDPTVDDENKDGKGSTTVTSDGNPYWTEDNPEIGPSDYDGWYYNKLSFRHLGKANHLMFDGSIRVVTNPLPLTSLQYNQ